MSAKKKTKKEPKMAAKQEVIVAYKGFAADLSCSPNGQKFQYEIGKTYTHKGEVAACASGFHACKYPLDVFAYYAPAEARYCVVEQSGKIARDGGDSKIASASITIRAEIKLPELVTRAVEWILSKVDFTNAQATNTGDWSAATNTGYLSAATNTGDQSAATNTGDQSAATNTGDQSAATNTGY